MKCLDCLEDLIEVPTSHGPGLDVCFSRHGLWLDVGEVNFFVKDYTSLNRAIGDTGGIAARTETLCPRCGIRPAEPLLSSPFSGLPCVFFPMPWRSMSASESVRDERPLPRARRQPFFVRDTTERVLVIPPGAELILPAERTYRNNWRGALLPTAIDGLNRLGISTEAWIGNKTLRCRESFIQPDEQVYVLGTAQEHLSATERVENSARLSIENS